jgi:hypothetical protein
LAAIRDDDVDIAENGLIRYVAEFIDVSLYSPKFDVNTSNFTRLEPVNGIAEG